MRESSTRPFRFTGRIRSIQFAFTGIRTMLRSQHNAWVHSCATIAVVAAGAVLISAMGSIIIGVLVLGPRIIALA